MNSLMNSMNILLLGSGGREDAIGVALSSSALCEKLYCAPGSGNAVEYSTIVSNLDIMSPEAVCEFACENDIALVVIGPEAPLVAGVADRLRSSGIAVFGPDSQGAMLEGSKAYSKEFMINNNLPTAAYACFDDESLALAYVEEIGAPVVVKADGLAAGKGVIICDKIEDAKSAIGDCFSGAFGEAGKTVLIEEFMTGPECSLLAFVSNGQAVCMPAAQDHKRAFDGDLGPNTGGMGVYSPVPIVSDEEMHAMTDIMQRAARATSQEPFETDYRGVLYGGFMLTPKGPKLLEFNARFGDPETQVILPKLESDLVEVMFAVASGRLSDMSVKFHDEWTVCVVLASKGYPSAYEKGKVILGVSDACALDGVRVYHAGTKVDKNGELVTAGGRVLNVVASASTFEEARELAYEACDLIHFDGKQCRSDIGKKAALGRDAWS